MDDIRLYIEELKATLDQLPWEAIRDVVSVLHYARLNDRQVFILGNGGSAATASHFACDLGKGTIVPGWPRFRVITLTDNVPLMTAWANDTGYENIFAQQLAGLIQEGDVVIGISGSGNSANVLNAIRLARDRLAITVGLTGFGGGQLKELVDVCLLVPSFCMEQVEDVHLILEHLMCTYIRALGWEEVLSQMASRGQKPVTGDRVFQDLVERLTHSLKVTVSSLATLDGQEDSLVVCATGSIRFLESTPPVGHRIPIGDVPAYLQVIQEEKPVLFQQNEPLPAIPSQELELTLTDGLKSGALLPLKVDGGVIGVVSLGEMRAWERSPFTQEKLNQGLSLVARWAQTLSDWRPAASSLPRTDQESKGEI